MSHPDPAAGVALALITASGRIVWSDERFAALAGESSLDSKAFAAAMVGAEAAVQAALAGRESHRTDLSPEGVTAAGEPVWLIRIGQLEPAADRSETDPTTGVLTRRAILARLESACGRAPGEPFVVLFLDLDGFKEVNDRWGHLAGDACLAEVGRRLRNALRAGDAVGRFGGDEFLIVLSGLSDPAVASSIEGRLAAAVSAPIAIREGAVKLGVSVGAATGDGRSPEELIDAADRAMYAQKAARRDGWGG